RRGLAQAREVGVLLERVEAAEAAVHRALEVGERRPRLARPSVGGRAVVVDRGRVRGYLRGDREHQDRAGPGAALHVPPGQVERGLDAKVRQDPLRREPLVLGAALLGSLTERRDLQLAGDAGDRRDRVLRGRAAQPRGQGGQRRAVAIVAAALLAEGLLQRR